MQAPRVREPDPEMWVPDGYVVISVDSRGAGKSPGRLDPNSPAEFRDFYDAVEWAGTQSWSSGKVGLLGISYYAAGQWFVAAMRPPHLAAILPWQGTYDFYRDRTRQDGIYASGFLKRWWNRSVLRNQHGNPDTDCRDIYTGERATGPATLSQARLAANRTDYLGDVLAHPLNDSFYQDRTPDLSKIEYPALVIANWVAWDFICAERSGAIWESLRVKNGLRSNPAHIFILFCSRGTRRCKNGSSTVTSKASTTIGKMNRPLKLKYAGPVTL